MKLRTSEVRRLLMRIEEWAGAGSNVIPVVGGKCTLHLYSDSHACQIVKVSPSGKTIWLRRNVVTVDPNSEKGMGHQDWVIHENEFMKVRSNQTLCLAEEPDNYTFYKATKRKNGNWRTSGSNLYVQIGVAHEYYDWSF